jgi:hypothetical protein
VEVHHSAPHFGNERSDFTLSANKHAATPRLSISIDIVAGRGEGPSMRENDLAIRFAPYGSTLH